MPILARQRELERLAPAGFFVAIRVGFMTPEQELNSFPDTWVDFYTENGLALADPCLVWTAGHDGSIRWSDLDIEDPQEILSTYDENGFHFGAVVSIRATPDNRKRSYGVFSREDREFNGKELQLLFQIVDQAHRSGAPDTILTKAQAEALRMVAEGRRMKEMAYELGISESAVKARLKSAQERIGAKTVAQAASYALAQGML